jgi:exo-rhamnogalacturonan lyase-like protein
VNSAALLILSALAFAAGGDLRLPLRVVGDPALPVSAGIPLPRGSLGAGDPVRARAAGSLLPAQSRPLAAWDDGSTKWLLVDVDPAGKKELLLEAGEAPADPRAALAVAGADGVTLQTGAASLLIPGEGALFPLGLRSRAPEFAARLDLEATIDGREPAGSAGEVERVAIEDEGPVRVSASAAGALAEGSGARVRLRVEAWAGRGAFRIALQVVAADRAVRLDALRLVLAPSAAGASRVRFAFPGPAGGGALDENEWVLEQGTDAFALREGTRARQTGRRAPGWAALTVGDASASLAIERFAELGPGSLRASRGGRLAVDLAPSGFELRARSALRRDLVVAIAPADAARAGPSARLPAADGWPALSASPTRVADSGAVGPLTAAPDPALGGWERLAGRVLDAHVAERERARAFGPRDFGDWPLGAGAFGNLEFDGGLGFLLGWLRTGDRRWLDEARASLRHWRDVDVAWSDAGPGLPKMHGPDHGDRLDCGHVWLEGALLDGLVSGDPWALEAAESVHEGLLGEIAADPATASIERGLGWTLFSICGGRTLAESPRFARRDADVRRALVDSLVRAEGGRGYLVLRPDEGESRRRTARANPWVTLGITLEGACRAYEIEPRADLRGAIERLASTIGREAFDEKKGTICGGLFFDLDAPGARPRRSRPVTPDAAIFAARGLAHAAVAIGNASWLARARDVASRAVGATGDALARFSGRERTRLLVAGPALLRHLRGP